MKVTLIDYMGTDLSVVNAARVSFGKQSNYEIKDFETERAAVEFAEKVKGKLDYECISSGRWFGVYPVEYLEDKDVKLIKYLAKHKHYSPFGHCFASFHVKAPVFVRARLVKHEYLRMNEISRGYVDTTPEFYYPEVWRGKPDNKKQGSAGTVKVDDLDYLRACSNAEDVYLGLLHKGVAPEQARMVLPQSMYTEWYWSGSLDAFANMYNLRSKPDAQEETRLIAEQIGDIMQGLYPHSWEALTNAN